MASELKIASALTFESRWPISSWIESGRPKRTPRTRASARPSCVRGSDAASRATSWRASPWPAAPTSRLVRGLARLSPIERAPRRQEAIGRPYSAGLRFFSGFGGDVRLANPIADPRLSDDEVPQAAGRVGRRQLVAQLADVHVDVAVLALVSLAPDSAQKPSLRDDPAHL